MNEDQVFQLKRYSMTLRIDASCIDKDGNRNNIDLGLGGHLMGFESYRQTFWGSPFMIDMGLKILPSLAQKAIIFVKDDELDILREEAITIQQNLDFVLKNVHNDEQFVMHRTDNIINAVDIAKKCNGEVSIG